MGDGPHPTDSSGQDGEYSLPLSVAGKTDVNGQRFVLGSNARTGADRRFLPPVREVSSSVWVLGATAEVSQRMVRRQALWPCVECVSEQTSGRCGTVTIGMTLTARDRYRLRRRSALSW